MASQLPFQVPPGFAAQVHIIDSTVRVTEMPVNLVLAPDLKGFDKFAPIASWSFLIQSSRGEKVLFDLSIPPDINEYTPFLKELLFDKIGIKLDSFKHVSEILIDNGVDPSEISSVIWSHHHWDHIGDITTFPGTTEVVVGPDFKTSYFPGYPTEKESPLPTKYLEGRKIREITFSENATTLKIGSFRAHDFFGDGSFYLLDTPGHTVGHLAGLARTTTNPDTFILMGGDLCHHGGELRPSEHLPLPIIINWNLPETAQQHSYSCPGGASFRELNIRRGRQPNEPFFDPVGAHDLDQAIQTIKDTQVADAQSDVFFIFAHDMGILGVVDFFPQPANLWKEKGWREKALWNFLADLALAAGPP